MISSTNLHTCHSASNHLLKELQISLHVTVRTNAVVHCVNHRAHLVDGDGGVYCLRTLFSHHCVVSPNYHSHSAYAHLEKIISNMMPSVILYFLCVRTPAFRRWNLSYQIPKCQIQSKQCVVLLHG